MRALVLLVFFFQNQAYAAIPSRVLPEALPNLLPAFTPSPTPPDIIRVSLGSHNFATIHGLDLKVDGKSLGTGIMDFPIQCDSDSETPINLVGLGRVASPANLESPTGFIWFNKHSYRSRLTIYAQNGQCLFVNTLLMDHYLAALLNKEMAPSWPLEALKAQAIASRTYALFQKSQSHNRFFDLENTTTDQVYEGSESETVRSHLAVQSTAALTLTWKGEPIKAFYHANCGGRTEVPSDVWGGNYAYFKPVICPYHQSPETQSRWTYTVSREQLERVLRRIAGVLPQNFLRVASLEAGPLNSNHRLQNIRVHDSQGMQITIPANTFRNAVGNMKLKSTAFGLQNHGDSFSISGQGFGHGVGLCQIGAREMARQGRSFHEILSFYYPLAKLSHLQ